MKKLISVVLCAVMFIFCFTGCQSTGNRSKIVVEDEAFSVTPQEFVEMWNAHLDVIKKANQSMDEAGLLEHLPDFVDSGKAHTFAKTSIVIYHSDSDGMMTNVEFQWYDYGFQEDEVNSAIIVSQLPGLFGHDTSVNMIEALNFTSSNAVGTDEYIDSENGVTYTRYRLLKDVTLDILEIAPTKKV